MQSKKLKASNFAKSSGHPLVIEGNQLKYPQDHAKTPLYLQTGDPTKFGFDQVKMPEKGYEILREKIKSAYNHGYCPSNGLRATRLAVAEAFSAKDFQLKEDDVIICNGGGIALMQMMVGMVSSGENILIPSVGFPYYQGISQALGVELRGYKLQADKNWEIDLADLEKKIDEKTKFIYIINPSNPCGSVFSKEHILEILAVCDKLKVPIVADEIYWNMVYPGVEFHAFGHLTTNVPVITMMALDKAFLVPGWALGWLMIYDKNKVFSKAKEGLLALSQIYLHPNTFIQQALGGILKEVGLNFVKKDIMPLFESNRELMMTELSEIKGLIPIKPFGSIFMSVVTDLKHFPEFTNDKQFLQRLIDEENISAFPLSSFAYDSPEINGFRLLCCANEEFYKEFFLRLSSFCSRHYRD